MPNTRSPTRGSMGFWPRKRAKRIYPRIKSWPKSSESKPLGFAGYKIGMTHAFIVDNNPNSKTKGQEISTPVTILECPPLSVFGFRCYLDSQCVGDVISDSLDKNLSRKIKVPKKSRKEEQLKKLDGKKINDVYLLCHTNPTFKKRPEVFEIALGGDKQLEIAKNLLGKHIKIADVFKDGDYIDVTAVTKGKGFQGPVKRFGIKILRPKAQQMQRHTGSLGTTEPGKVRSTVPQGGQMGFQTRTELNKRLLKIVDGKEVNPKGGFLRFGLASGDCILVEGSVPGSRRRLIRMRTALRYPKTKYPVNVKYISTTSKQGV